VISRAEGEDELDRVRRIRGEALELVRRHIDEVPIEDVLLQQIRLPGPISTMLSCARLGHPTRSPEDPPKAPCVCRWRK
jgi:hypothetical protein